jgi:hypothetical protein
MAGFLAVTVDEYIGAEIAKPFRWGETDCASTADRWVRLRAGFSPMAIFGRQHRNEEEARAWLAEPGGIAVAFNRVMRSAGFRKTETPRAGDLGLAFFDRRVCIAIHAGAIWFSRHEDGFVGAPLGNVWKAWSI